MNRQFTIEPTGDRLNAQGFFIAQLNPSDIRKGGYQIGKDILICNSSEGFTFQIKARLQAFSEVKEGIIRLDQKIRMAIGVDTGGKVTISALEGTYEATRKFSEKVFGKQENLLRVRKATFTDMEINICRLQNTVMKSIGVEEGDKIIVEAGQKWIEIRTLELTSDIIESRIKKEDDKDSTYYSKDDKRRKALQKGNVLEYDLPWILMDRDAREKLGIKAYHPVTVYRSNSYAIKTKLHSITLPMIGGIVGFMVGLHYLLPEDNIAVKAAIQASVFFGGLLLTVWLNLLSVRKRLK